MNEIIKYLCPDCHGTGQVMIGKLYPNGHTETWEDCEFCEGNGDFDEDEYLILRISGKI
jgi:DnaJ-class molecular chaperone